MGTTEIGAKRLRSVHIPLADEQWLALKMEAAKSGRTLGEVVADALAQANGSSAPLTEADARAATKGV